MSKGRKVLEEIKEILLANKIFSDVSFSRPKAITEETVFPMCYVYEIGEIADFRGIGNTGIKGYTKEMTICVKLNLNMQDPLEYKDYQEKVERAILSDSRIWKTVIDRDLDNSAWDGNAYFDESTYKKEGGIFFKVKYISDC